MPDTLHSMFSLRLCLQETWTSVTPAIADPDLYVGSYLVQWATLQSCLPLSREQPDWLVSVRVVVSDVQEPLCSHQKHTAVVTVDCFHPKHDDVIATETLLREYGETQTWFREHCQIFQLPLCSECRGLDLQPDMALTSDTTCCLLERRDKWKHWHFLCDKFRVLLPLIPVSNHEYVQIYRNEEGREFFYPPLRQSVPAEERRDGTHFQERKTKHAFLPPYQYHALYWIFAFLHEILYKHYQTVKHIKPEKRHCRKFDQWAQRHARKIQAAPDGTPHRLWFAMSPLGQRIADLDSFVSVMYSLMSDWAAGACGKDIFGFAELTLQDIDLMHIAVELAHVVDHLLPKTRWLQRATPRPM